MTRIPRRSSQAVAVALLTFLAVTAAACGAVHVLKGAGRKVAAASYLLGAACPPTGSCIAVGRPSRGAGTRGGIFVVASTGAVHTVAGTSGLDHAACPRTGFCILVGENASHNRNDFEEVYVDVRDGKAGSPHPLDGMTETSGIGCGTQSSCWIPGARCAPNSTACTPEVAHLVNGKLAKVYRLTGSYTFSTGPATSESSQRGPRPACYSATACVLGGMSDPNHPSQSTGLIFSLNDGAVTITHRIPSVNVISGLDCASKTYCTLVGYKTSSVKGKLLTLSNGRLGTPVSLQADVGPLACRSASACFAFGSQQSGGSGRVVVIPIDHGTPAAPETLPDTQLHPNIYGADCTPTRCLGAGNIGHYPAPEEGWILAF
jgi:hypothetical protein